MKARCQQVPRHAHLFFFFDTETTLLSPSMCLPTNDIHSKLFFLFFWPKLTTSSKSFMTSGNPDKCLVVDKPV